jgi:hypothetical protein
MKHYVKVVADGQTISDAFIVASSPSDALKLALAGQGIDLRKVEPDRCYTITCGDVMTSSYGDEFSRTGESSTMRDVPNAQGHLHAPAPVVRHGPKLTKEQVEQIRNFRDIDGVSRRAAQESEDAAKAYITKQEAERMARELVDGVAKKAMSRAIQNSLSRHLTGGPIGHAAEDIAKGEVGKVYLAPHTDPHGQRMSEGAIQKAIHRHLRDNLMPVDNGSMRDTWDNYGGVSKEELEEARRQIDAHYEFYTPSGRRPRQPALQNIPYPPHVQEKMDRLMRTFGAGPDKFKPAAYSNVTVDVESWRIERDFQSHGASRVEFKVQCPGCRVVIGVQFTSHGMTSPYMTCQCGPCNLIFKAKMPI